MVAYICELNRCLIAVVECSVLSSVEEEVVDYQWTIPSTVVCGIEKKSLLE